MSSNLSIVAIGIKPRLHLGSVPQTDQGAPMDLILLAVPLFFVLIAVELVADRVRGQRNYRLADRSTASAPACCRPVPAC
jgi:hypothetical protein